MRLRTLARLPPLGDQIKRKPLVLTSEIGGGCRDARRRPRVVVEFAEPLLRPKRRVVGIAVFTCSGFSSTESGVGCEPSDPCAPQPASQRPILSFKLPYPDAAHPQAIFDDNSPSLLGQLLELHAGYDLMVLATV